MHPPFAFNNTNSLVSTIIIRRVLIPSIFYEIVPLRNTVLVRFIRNIKLPRTAHAEVYLSLAYFRSTSHRLTPSDSSNVLAAHWTRAEEGHVCMCVKTAGSARHVTVVGLATLRTVGSLALAAETLLSVTLDHVERLAYGCWAHTE
jgi:hypothetical protein